MKPLHLLGLCLTLASLLPLQAQTELYQRYANMPGIKVASVSNFNIDSTSTVDVTVVQAESDSGWTWMKEEFSIGDLAPQQQASINNGSDVVLFARRDRTHPNRNAPIVGETIDASASCYMGISYLSRAVYIFCADRDEQYDAVVTLLVKKIMRSNR